GPSGTEARPGIPAKPPRSGGGAWKRVAALLGFAALLMVIATICISVAFLNHRSRTLHDQEAAARQAEGSSNVPDAAVSGETNKTARETLRERLEAASIMSNDTAKDKALSAVAADA